LHSAESQVSIPEAALFVEVDLTGDNNIAPRADDQAAARVLCCQCVVLVQSETAVVSYDRSANSVRQSYISRGTIITPSSAAEKSISRRDKPSAAVRHKEPFQAGMKYEQSGFMRSEVAYHVGPDLFCGIRPGVPHIDNGFVILLLHFV